VVLGLDEEQVVGQQLLELGLVEGQVEVVLVLVGHQAVLLQAALASSVEQVLVVASNSFLSFLSSSDKKKSGSSGAFT